MQSDLGRSQSLVDQMTHSLPTVLSPQVGCATHFNTARLKFKGEVPLDGGRQADFSWAAKPLIAKQIAKWISIGVVK